MNYERQKQERDLLIRTLHRFILSEYDFLEDIKDLDDIRRTKEYWNIVRSICRQNKGSDYDITIDDFLETFKSDIEQAPLFLETIQYL